MELKISKKSAELIIEAEVSSKAYYTKFLQSPIWPQGASGITIGIGYDCGHMSADTIKKDWAGMIPQKDIDTLAKCAGKISTKAQALLTTMPELKKIKVPFEPAKLVFYSNSLPKYARKTLVIYPGLEELEPDAIGALVSMVYNRGESLVGDSRKEMKAIVPLVLEKNYEGIAEQIELSKRLWTGKANMAGVFKRRQDEANLVRSAERAYSGDEILHVLV